MPKIYEIATGEKGPGNIIDETVLMQGGATTAATPAFTLDRPLDASTNTVTPALRLRRQSTGTPANGIGVSHEFAVETAAGNIEVGAVIEAVTTDVTAASEDFDLVFKNMAAGAAAAERVRIKSTGQMLIASNNNAGYPVPTLQFFSANCGFSNYNDSDLEGRVGGSAVYSINNAGPYFAMLNGYGIVFSAGAHTAKDAGIARKAAGVTEANNGTKGSYTGSAFGAGSQTVAQLPAAATAGKGARSFVTDASATTFLSTVAGGGANNVPVVSDGTNWLIG